MSISKAILAQTHLVQTIFGNMFSALCRPLDNGPQRRGGFRQRLAQPLPVAARPSRAALGHLLDWGEGSTSARQMVRHLNNIVADGETRHPMILRLAAAGEGDNARGSAAHGVARLMEQCGFARLITAIPNAPVSHMCLPSSLMTCLHAHFPQKLAEVLGADRNVFGRFWAGMRRDPHFTAFVNGHDVLRTFGQADWARLVPVTIHEDAGPYGIRKSCNIISWSSFFATGGAKDSQFPIASYIKNSDVPVTQEHLSNIWNPVFQDFEHLLVQGVGGLLFLPLFAKADMEGRSVGWGLPSYNSELCCSECRCDRGALSFTDLSSSAAWRGVLVGGVTDFRARARTPLHPLLTSSFFWRGFMPLDMMHVMDCKGVTAIVAGSILRPLIMSCAAMGRTQDERIGVVNQRLKTFYDQRPGYNRMPALRLSNLVDRGWSVLCGQVVKAANTRALTPFLVEIAEEFYSDATVDYNKLVVRAATTLDRIYTIMYNADAFLTDEEATFLRRALSRFGATIMQLREICRITNVFAWNVTPKMHAVQHFATFPAQINPRWIQCYTEESAVGLTTKIWARSANGRYRRTIQRTVLMKKVVALAIRFETNGGV